MSTRIGYAAHVVRKIALKFYGGAMLIRGIAGCLVGCIVSVALTFGFNLNGDVSFLVGIVCGTVCTGIALNI